VNPHYLSTTVDYYYYSKTSLRLVFVYDSNVTVVFKGALQLLINRYGYIRFTQVPERVSTKSFVVLIIGNSKSNHFGAQGTFKLIIVICRGAS